MVVHKGTTYQGLHRPIIEREAWDAVQKLLAKNRVDHRKQMRARVPSLLTGLLFDEAGERLTPSHANRGGLRYRYYISKSLTRGRPRADEQSKRWRIPAVEIENAVLVALGSFLDDQSALSSILSLGPLPPAQTASVLNTATALSRSLSQDHAGQLRPILHSILPALRSEIQRSRSPSHWDGCVRPSSCPCSLPTSLRPMPSLCPRALRSEGSSRS